MRLSLLLLLLLPYLSLGSVPTATVDLDATPALRWRQVAIDHGPLVKRMLKEALSVRFPKDLLPLLRIITLELDRYLSEPYHSELTGFARYSNISLGDLVALQLLYDATAYCTSIVCVDDKRRIWHARNLDYGMNAIEQWGLRKLTIDVTFIRGGKPLIRAATFAGYIGILTGMRYQGFSVTLNQRDKGSIYNNIYAAIIMVWKSGRLSPVSFRLRSLLETETDFKRVLDRLTSVPLIAPCYIILAGRRDNEGAVITRSQSGALDVYQLDLARDRWFVLETNYDRWVTPPPNDNRRKSAEDAMHKMGRNNVTVASLFKVLYTPPVLNTGTIFSTVMSANQSLAFVTIP